MKDKNKKIKRIIFLLVTIIVIPDLVKANTYLFENSTWQSGLRAAYFTSVALGDIDNDGDLDLAHIGCTGMSGTSCDSYISKIYTNDGTSLIDNSTWSQNLTAVHYGSIAWGDVDNDGDLDLALTGCNNGGGSVSACNDGEQSFIYINNGSTLVENSLWKGDIARVWKGSIAFGDIDLDGKLDLAVTGNGLTGNIAKIYINNGTGFAENSTWQSELTTLYESGIALGDIDNDGDLDLIITGDAGASDVRVKVYINNGSSLVENSTWQQNLLAVDLSAISLGDFDNNGRMDLTLIGHTNQDNHEIYNNTGSTFSLLQQAYGDDQSLLGIFEGSQAFGDYDNEGDLDLITSGEEQYTTLYLYSVTNSRFTSYLNDPEPDIFNTAFGPSTAWCDIDNDNDLDLVLVGYNYDILEKDAKIYTNSITTPNTAPNSPTTFTASFANNKMTFSWNNGSDTETPTLGLYYNLRVGTNSSGHQIVSGVYGGGDDNGYFGNMMQRKSISLNIQNQTYYWAVQTIDTGLKAGSWSREQRYPLDTIAANITVNSPANNTNSSNSTIIFNATASDDIRLENVSLFANFSGSYAINETNTSGTNNTVYLFTKNIADGSYIWSIRACAYYGSNCTFSENRTIMIDATYPVVTVLAPLNNSLLETSNIIVRAQFSDSNIVNCQVRNDSGNWYNMDNDGTTSGTANYTFTGLSSANHNLTINCSDILLSTIKTINFTIDTSSLDTTKPNIAITSPLNNSYLASSTVTLNVNFNDSTNTNCQAKIDTNSWQNMDNDGATAGIANYTFSSVADGNHSINVNCTDANSNNATSNISFVVDTIYPVVKLLSPSNGTRQTSSSTVTFSYNVTDVAIDNCSLIINNGVSSTATSITVNISQSISKSLSNANYNWSINCTDKAGNTNASNETRQITVSYSSGDGGSSGGGGGSSGGGGGGAVSATATSQTVNTGAVAAGGTASAEFTAANIVVADIKITVKQAVTASSVTVVNQGSDKGIATSAVTSTEVASDMAVYSYLKITVGKISNTNIEKATVKFKIPKSAGYEPATVELRKYDSSKKIWSSLPTTLTSQDASNYYFEAETTSFSIFAIIGKKLVTEEVEEPVNISEVEEEKVEKEPIAEIKEEKKSKAWLWILGSLGSLLIGLIVGYFYIKRKG